jgi:hypothetical protein
MRGELLVVFDARALGTILRGARVYWSKEERCNHRKYAELHWHSLITCRNFSGPKPIEL